jgi:hypothetical protein
MSVTNYYLVNKETQKVHYLLKVDPYFQSDDGTSETWLAGRLYRGETCCGPDFKELHELDFSDEYEIPNLHVCSADSVFEHYANIDYASVKGYRLFSQGDAFRQVHDDFGGTEIIEMNAFLSTLFQQFIGPAEVEKWSYGHGFDDKYGVNALVMENFTIETDDDENIFYHQRLTDDYDWKGFTTGQ